MTNSRDIKHPIALSLGPYRPGAERLSVLAGARIVDDRGRMFPVERRGRNVVPLRTLRSLFRKHPRVRRPIVRALGVALLAMTAGSAIEYFELARSVAFGVVLALLAFIAVVFLIWSVALAGTRLNRITCLTWGKCPACLYPVKDLRAAEDGCTVCPECGGAWRLPAVERG